MGDDAANRPPNCRLFLGNLASEKTSRAELMEIFGKYGNIVEEIVMRRSFGFIQYDSPEAALAALQNEQGRPIGGLRVDISLADNRDSRPKKRREREEEGRFPRGAGATGSRYDRYGGGDRYGGRDDRDQRRGVGNRDGPEFKRSRFDEPPRQRSPPRDARGGGAWRDQKQQQSVAYSVVYLGLNQKAYANDIRQMLEDRLGLGPQSGVVETTFLGRLSMDEIFSSAERRAIQYVLIVSGKHERSNTVDIHLLQPGRPKSSFRDVSSREAIDIITQKTGNVGPNAPSLGYGGQQGPPPPASGYYPTTGAPPPQAAAPMTGGYGAPPPAYGAVPAGGPASYGGVAAPLPPQYPQSQPATAASAQPNLQALLSAAGGGANLVAALASLLTGMQGPTPAGAPATSSSVPPTQYAPLSHSGNTAAAPPSATVPQQHQPQQPPVSQPSHAQTSVDAALPSQLASLLNETNLALLSNSMTSLLSQPQQQQQSSGGYAAYGQPQPQPQQQQAQPQYQQSSSYQQSAPSSSMQPQQQQSSAYRPPMQQGQGQGQQLASAYRPVQQQQQQYGATSAASYPPPAQQQQSYGGVPPQQRPPTQQGWGQPSAGGYKPQ